MQIYNQIPPPTRNKWKANLDKLKVNESLQIGMQHYNSVKAAMSTHFHNRNGKAFTTSKEGKTHFRIWRLE